MQAQRKTTISFVAPMHHFFCRPFHAESREFVVRPRNSEREGNDRRTFPFFIGPIGIGLLPKQFLILRW
jgi:hypothetical protein